MMRAVIERVDMGAFRPQGILHVGMELAHGRFLVVAAGDAGLVGDDDHVIAGLIEQPHGFWRACDPFKLFGPVGIAVVDIEHAVAIEKRCRTLALVDAQNRNSVFLNRRIYLYKRRIMVR